MVYGLLFFLLIHNLFPHCGHNHANVNKVDEIWFITNP